jgi:transposase
VHHVEPHPANVPLDTHTFIFHGVLDPDDNRIDTDEEIQARQKFIYNMRYYAWKRLNRKFSSLPPGSQNVDWNNVHAYFYRHSDDSVWTDIFSPPIFWSPVEKASTVLQRLAKGIFTGNYDFAETEIPETNLEMIKKIAVLLRNRKQVLLYGFSVGGLVVQRICELFNMCIEDENLSELILGFKLVSENEKENQIMMNHLKAATFGSIYISPPYRVRHINLTNYMLTDDVSTKTNFFNFGLGYLVPTFQDNDLRIRRVCTDKHVVLYEYLYDDENNVVFIQKWHSEWYDFWKQREKVQHTVFTDYSIDQLKNMFKKNNEKYEVLYNKLLRTRTTNVEELPDTCDAYPRAILPGNAVAPIVQPPAADVPVAVEVADAPQIAIPIPENIHPVVFDAPDNIIQLIGSEAKAVPNIYDSQDQLVYRDQAIITQELAELARIRQRQEQLQNNLRGRGEAPREINNGLRDIRRQRREISTHLNAEIRRLVENGVKELIAGQYTTVDGEFPQENLLNVSNVLAQLAVQSVFLFDQGVGNMKNLVDTAIDIGRGYKEDIRRRQQGGGNKKYVPPPHSSDKEK